MAKMELRIISHNLWVILGFRHVGHTCLAGLLSASFCSHAPIGLGPLLHQFSYVEAVVLLLPCGTTILVCIGNIYNSIFGDH